MHSSDAWRELGSTKGKSKKAMYKFTRPDNWEEIEDFLEQTGGTDCEEQIAKSGYNPRPDATIGTPEFGALAIEIYSSANDHRVDTPYDFLVCIEIAGVGYFVAASNFPDLVELLSKVGILAAAIGVDKDN